MAHDVFISYASGDKAIANAVCSQLEAKHRIRCWIAPRDITAGASWAESIIDALDSAKIMVLIFSSNANASMQIEREVERAVHKGINIIPLRIENTTPTKTLEYFISAPHWLDAMSAPLEEHVETLATSVASLLARSGGGGPATSPSQAPADAPAVLPPTTAVREQPPQRSTGRLVPLAGGLLVVVLAIAGAAWFATRPAPVGPAPSASDLVAQPAPAPVAGASPGAAPAPSLPPPGASPAPPRPAASPAPPVRAAASPRPKPPVAPPAVAAGAAPKPLPAKVTPNVQKAAPNLHIDFVNPISEGRLVLNIDGSEQWSADLAPPAPSPSETPKPEKQNETAKAVRHALVLTDGPHKVDVLLLRPDGTTRERKALDLIVDGAAPQTLRIRLSRFKRDIQLTKVAGVPRAATDPPGAEDAGDSGTSPGAKKPAPEANRK